MSAIALSPRGRAVRPRFIAVVVLLALGVAAIYGQTRNHGFINYDDDVYITGNRIVTSGLTSAALRQAWEIAAANWHPLTWHSHQIDWALFGPWAGGHHLVSAAFHAVNAMLLFGVLAVMTGSFWRSAAVAALFAFHPLRVESVAWAAERKDVLSAFFWLAAMGAYLRYARRPGAGRYLLVLGLFAVGLTAKPMLVTLPFVLLLLDWWPLGRVSDRDGRPARGGRSWVALALEKMPLFALSAASSIITYLAQTGSTVPMVRPDWPTRLANAVVSYASYLGSFVWPKDLAFLYPYPRAGIPARELAGAAATLAAVTAAALLGRRRRPWLLAGWLWYLGALAPVIGLVQIGAQARSDRYTYLAMIGVAAAVVWSVGEAAGSRPHRRRAAAATLCAGLAALAGSSHAYVGVWRDSLALMSYTAKVTRDNYIVLDNLGLALQDAGRTAEAVPIFREAAGINPEHCNAPYNLGQALMRLGRFQQALEPLTRALACYEHGGHRRDYVADTLVNLGTAELRLGRPAVAERRFRSALAILPSRTASAGLREAQARQVPVRRADEDGTP